MTTPYNLRNALERSGEAKRQEINDPGSGGTVRFKPFDLSVLKCATAGTRTFESAVTMPLGNSVIVVSSIASVVISASSVSYTLNAGEYIELVVVLDSSGVNTWGLRRATANPSATMSAELPITGWRADAALQTVLATATTSSTLFQILNNTYGTTASDLQVKAAGTGSVSIAARHPLVLPVNYRAGTDISIIAAVTRTTAATTNGTLVFQAYRPAAPTVNLIATAAADINSAASVTVTDVITGTNLNPGDLIDVRGLVATDGGSTTAGEWHITSIKLTYTKA